MRIMRAAVRYNKMPQQQACYSNSEKKTKTTTAKAKLQKLKARTLLRRKFATKKRHRHHPSHQIINNQAFCQR